jgi:histidinol-phosphate aminotransferase
VALLAKASNLILLRTFSKAYGLAGARVGYALCGSERVAREISAELPPFPVSDLARAAAEEALGEEEALAGRLALAAEQRTRLAAALRGHGLRPTASKANFVWARLAPRVSERIVVEALARRGVIVAAGSELCGVSGLRIGCGTAEQVDRCIAAIRPALLEAGAVA